MYARYSKTDNRYQRNVTHHKINEINELSDRISIVGISESKLSSKVAFDLKTELVKKFNNKAN